MSTLRCLLFYALILWFSTQVIFGIMYGFWGLVLGSLCWLIGVKTGELITDWRPHDSV